MKRIFYQLEDDLYFDWDGFIDMAEGSGLNAKELKGAPLIREGRTYLNTINHLVQVN